MRLTEYFHDNNNDPTVPTRNQNNPFNNKSSWTPPSDRDSALNAYIGAIKSDIITSNLNHITDNLTQHERQALRNLKKRQDIIINPADKGSGTVVMDRTWYVDECNRQLNDPKFYKKQDGDITNQIQERVTTYVQRMLKDGYIDDKTKQNLYKLTLNLDAFTFYLKYTKLATRDVP